MPGHRDLPGRGRAGEPPPVHREEQGSIPERDAARETDEIGEREEARGERRPRDLTGADSPFSARPSPLAVTLDFWDTLYDSSNLPERLALRRRAIAALLGAYEIALPDEEVARLYKAAAREAHRWWSEEHRAYTTADRLRWIIERAGGRPRPQCGHVAAACDAVDEALLRYPPPLLPGAADAVRALAARFPLAIVSDTGFGSGRAQDALLEQDGLLGFFTATIYSMDVGYPKPRPEPFHAAVAALGASSSTAVIHIGDNERTDVGGALAAGLRAVRLDVMRGGGASAGEFVARTFAELVEYLTNPDYEIGPEGSK
jgi:HAD superfamily hydrolase (TIGR01549 family)